MHTCLRLRAVIGDLGGYALRYLDADPLAFDTWIMVLA
jgi:hypothetical protein